MERAYPGKGKGTKDVLYPPFRSNKKKKRKYLCHTYLFLKERGKESFRVYSLSSNSVERFLVMVLLLDAPRYGLNKYFECYTSSFSKNVDQA